ncbi:hypothetical protein MLD38_034065 [Melastoma candidum]|uniref:Uncharacterized protein n=1 Tax=Melastoma candidum TaxID=119954 RepID=A0ACB9MBC6_9MYRT|nr:hypothetical protein MLD38_034065 [Melastoma candidum]
MDLRILPSCRAPPSQLHAHFLKGGFLCPAVILCNRLLQCYLRTGRTADARRLFDEMPVRNSFSWNSMIEGYLAAGDTKSSLELFESMPCRNEFSWNLVISGFSKVDDLVTVRRLFDAMPVKSVVARNSLFHGLLRRGFCREVMGLFREMNRNGGEEVWDDAFIFTTVIGACTRLEDSIGGKQIHAKLIVNGTKFDAFLISSLVNFYGKCGNLHCAARVLSLEETPDDFSLSALISSFASCGNMIEARRVFAIKTNPSVELWNSLISGYVCNGQELEAIVLFNEMRETGVGEDFSTVVSVLSAFSSLKDLLHGKAMHNHVHKSGFLDSIVVATALVDMYQKCGSPSDACKFFSEVETYDTVLLNSMITVYSNSGQMEDAKTLFSSIPCKTLVSWNAMVVGLSRNGCAVEALEIFYEMNLRGFMMDEVSYASVIAACASISSHDLGEQIFTRAIVIGLECDPIVATALVDFYCKCGHIEKGRKVFNRMVGLDVVSWNTMLMGYATNGYGIEALDLFLEMRNSSNVQPDGITYSAVLSACGHCGLVGVGTKWFNAMKSDDGIEPRVEHYSCMVDLYSRAGFMNDAVYLIEKMPYEADASMWSSILRGCVAHGDKTLGKCIAEKIISLDPQNAGAYVQLSGILADFGDWETSAVVRNEMKEMGVEKEPACSWANSLSIRH